MWNLKVPKTAYFYWGANKIPFLRYMSLYSFRKMNPDWEIKLYVPAILSKDIKWFGKQVESTEEGLGCRDYAYNLQYQLGIKPILFDFDELGLSNELNEVHKSDFLRYHLLSTKGGVWSDMDVLYIKPITELLCNKVKSTSSAFYYYGSGNGDIPGHSIGFLMSEPQNRYFADVLEAAKRTFRASDYQGAGAEMLNRLFPLSRLQSEYSDCEGLDRDSVYAINHVYKNFLYNQTNLSMLTDNSIGIHWYGGSEYSKHLILYTDHSNYKTRTNKGTLMSALKINFPNFI